MDLLKKELERKKKTVEKARAASGGRRFFRASELRRQEEEQEEDKDDDVKASRKRKLSDDDEEENDNKKSSLKKKSSENETTKGDSNKTGTDQNNKTGEKSEISQKVKTGTTQGSSNDNGDGDEESAASLKMSAQEITQRLRALGFPIKLFGESTLDRLKRLRKALDEQKNVQAGLSEMEEFRLGRGHGIRNPFLEKDDDKDTHGDPHVEDVPGDSNETAQGSKNAGDKNNNKQDDNDNDLDENDPHKRVYKYFKGLVKQWEEDLNSRPDAVKKSVAGRNETKTFKQCKDYVRPMFKLCKNRRMDESILTKLNKIVTFCLEEEFVKAHDTYIDISIGRAAWPIGVTQVGIHSRTGRAKIESSNIAHVMNSELQRKYLTSVKRLMTYAQKHSNADPSKKVL